MKPHKQGSVEEIEDCRNLDEDVDRLRSLILGNKYQDAIESLLSQDNDEARVAKVISEAIKKRSEEDSTVSTSLAPIVDSALQTSINENPNRIINVIFPILGPAVRKAVSVALTDLMQTLNHALEQSLNVKSLWWRLQAKHAGLSYVQFVMLKTLAYRVEQVLLVHRRTGILLHHVAQPDVQTQDPELVSSMLTAISDFVSDSFSHQASDTLEAVRFGEFYLQIDVGPGVIIAAAVRGTINNQARTQINKTLENIETSFSNEIQSFNGDSTVFSESESDLKSCLLSQSIEDKKTTKIPVMALLALFAVIGLLGYWGYSQFTANKEYQRIIGLLNEEPGYVLINHKMSKETITGTLLRDPMARPLSLVTEELSRNELSLELDTKLVYFEHPETNAPLNDIEVNQSIQQLLNSFDNIEIQSQEGVLKISGQISQESLNRITSNSMIDRNFDYIDVSELTVRSTEELVQAAQPMSEQYRQLMHKIGNVSVYFLPSSLELDQESQLKLTELASNLKKLEKIQEENGYPLFELLIMGFADSQGSDDTNQRISQLRANQIQALLLNKGVESIPIVSWGLGHVDGSTLSEYSQRRVSISVYSEFRNSNEIGTP